MVSGGAGTIAVTDSSFLPSSQPSSGSWISHCILQLWLWPVLEGVHLQWSRRRRRTGQVHPEQRGESSLRVFPGTMQNHVWQLHADLIMFAPDVEESIKRGCALSPRRHRTLPQVKDRDMHEELHHLTLNMRVLYSHPI